MIGKTPSIRDIRAAAEARRRGRRRRRVAWGAVVGLVVLVIFGVAGLSVIMRGQLEAQLGEASGREVALGKVRLKPLALSGAVKAFEIKARDSSR